MNKIPLVIVAVIFLLFGGVGVGFAVWIALTVRSHLEIQRWPEVPATIVKTDLVRHTGNKGGASYEATASYRYSFNNQTYIGTRVGLSKGADNIGSYQRDIYTELIQYQKSGKPFRCFVNPEQPEEAILYRTMRWAMIDFQMIFVIAFGGVGFGILGAALASAGAARATRVAKNFDRQKPWLARGDWASRQMVFSERAKAVAWLFVAMFANLAMIPIWIELPQIIADRNQTPAMLTLLGPFLALVLLLVAFKTFNRWRRFGQSVFLMAADTGVIGGPLAGVVRTSAKVVPDDGFMVTLNCIERVTVGTGKNQRTEDHVLWSDERKVIHELAEDDPTQSAIPILFGIPFDGRATDWFYSRDVTLWQLEVTAKASGTKYLAKFEVPVFKTAESNSQFALDESAVAAYEAPPDPDRLLTVAGIVHSVEGGSQYFDFPASRNRGTALGVAIFAAVFITITVVLYRVPAPKLFTLIFALVDFALVYFTLDLLLYNNSIEVSHGVVAARGGWLGSGARCEIMASDLQKIDTAQSMQSGSTYYYNLFARLKNGRSIRLAKNIRGFVCAKAVADRITQIMGPAEPSR